MRSLETIAVELGKKFCIMYHKDMMIGEEGEEGEENHLCIIRT
jgi:hypothetical protein